MSEVMSEVPKALSSLGSGVVSGWKLAAHIQKRFTRLREVRERGGEMGIFFGLFYAGCQYFYAILLVLCALASLLTFVGGTLKILNISSEPQFLIAAYEDFSVPLLILALFLVIITSLNALSWIPIILLGWIPTRWLPLKQSAGWHNLHEFAKPLEEPRPLFLNKEGITRLADKAIAQLLQPGNPNADFAEKPNLPNTDERANAALFGCILEREHRVQKWPSRKWKPFYAAVAAAQQAGHSILSPDFINATAPNIDFYGLLRQEINIHLPKDEPELPDSPAVMDDISKAVHLLATKYQGSARFLALNWWHKMPHLRLAFNRALDFYPFEEQSMVPQFLKLAVRWDVWPGVRIGNFIYPFALTVGAMMLEENVLVTIADAKSFAFKSSGELASYREAMRRTVQKVEQILSDSKQEQHQNYLKGLQAAGHPRQWELAAGVDFSVWSMSRAMSQANSFKVWKLDGTDFVTLKK